MKLDITIDPESLKKMREVLDPKNVPKALSAAANRTATGLRTQTVRTVRETINMKAGDVRARITIKRGSPSAPGAYLKILRKPVPLFEYSARQTKRGVSVGVRKGGGRTMIPHTFLATMKSGHKGVFVREDLSKRSVTTLKQALKRFKVSISDLLGKRQKHGLPIRELFGPTVVGVVAGDPAIVPKLESYGAYQMVKQMESQISRFGAAQAAEAAESTTDPD